MSQKKEKDKKIKIEFECAQNHRCFSKTDDPVCPFSPCPLNLNDFGRHQQIIEYYLNKEELDDAFYYFRDLMGKFPIDCDVSQLNGILEERRKTNTQKTNKKAMPVGCQLYIEVDRLTTLKNDVIYKYEEIPREELSRDGLKLYIQAKQQFSKKLRGNLTRLEHLVNSKKEEIRKEKVERAYNIELTRAQMGTLKPKSVEMPINQDVTDALQGTQKTKNKKVSGI